MLMALSMVALAAGPALGLEVVAAIVFLATFAPGFWAIVSPSPPTGER